MKLDKPGQSALFKLCEVEITIERIKAEISKAVNSAELTAKSAELSEYSEAVIVARTNFENLNMEARKADDNLHMVEERIARDVERLNQTSSPKDAQAMQSEVESLTARKEELEEIELEILERLEVSKAELEHISAKRETASKEIDDLRETIQAEVDELKTQGRKLTAEREILIGKLPAEILERYKSLAIRQVAVGKIESRSCTACHMGLTANTIDSIAELPEDQLGFCPECLAMIVR
jgi:predicted  nucleic acid-binding Zn-ribbon protein